jgi:hypothetical protein
MLESDPRPQSPTCSTRWNASPMTPACSPRSAWRTRHLAALELKKSKD